MKGYHHANSPRLALRHHPARRSQGEGVNFSCEDKLRISRKLDEVGVHYIEGGWPGSNPKDIEYYQRAPRELRLKQARVVAFGSTVKAGVDPADDPQIRLLVDAETPVICILARPGTCTCTRSCARRWTRTCA